MNKIDDSSDGYRASHMNSFQMHGIVGAVAVVTGAAQGNGRAIAEGLARAGAKVAICDINLTEAQEVADTLTVEGLVAKPFPLDVTQSSACNSLADAVSASLGNVDILVNNAGIIRRTPPDAEGFEADWQAVLRVNADGPMFMIRAFLPQLRASKGRIINIASIMSVSAGPALSAYAASKGAVLQLTKALAHDLAPDGIRVNAIAPGVFSTPMGFRRLLVGAPRQSG